jgi:hypothetical protein
MTLTKIMETMIEMTGGLEGVLVDEKEDQPEQEDEERVAGREEDIIEVFADFVLFVCC